MVGAKKRRITWRRSHFPLNFSFLLGQPCSIHYSPRTLRSLASTICGPWSTYTILLLSKQNLRQRPVIDITTPATTPLRFRFGNMWSTQIRQTEGRYSQGTVMTHTHIEILYFTIWKSLSSLPHPEGSFTQLTLHKQFFHELWKQFRLNCKLSRDLTLPFCRLERIV